MLGAIEKLNKKAKLPTLEAFIEEQATKQICKQARSTIGKPESTFTANRNEIVVRVALNDGAVQKAVQASMHQSVLHLAHHPGLERHPEESCMYGALRKKYCGPKMAMNVYKVFAACQTFPKMESKRKN